jgi:hypothetical protein
VVASLYVIISGAPYAVVYRKCIKLLFVQLLKFPLVQESRPGAWQPWDTLAWQPGLAALQPGKSPGAWPPKRVWRRSSHRQVTAGGQSPPGLVTAQCSAVQCSAVQCSAVQCTAVQCSAVASRAGDCTLSSVSD